MRPSSQYIIASIISPFKSAVKRDRTTMHMLARHLVILVGIGLVAAEPAGPSLPGVKLPSLREQGPSLGEQSLPAPRALPASPPHEEPAPAPREQMILPNTPPLSGSSREEPAPMPHEQNPSPPRLAMPGYLRGAPPVEVQTLHREIEGLKMECEAMLVEEIDLLTKKDPHAPKIDESARLRRRVTELLTKAAQMPAKAPTQAPSANGRRKPAGTGQNQPADAGHSPKESAPPAHSTPSAPPGKPAKQADNSGKILTDAPVDPLTLAQTLFLAGDHAGALNLYRQLEKEEQSTEGRITIQYMLACCLRKLGKTDEASTLYREVANSDGNDVLVENAQWYLRAMKERRELETQFDELRQRRQALTPRKP
ncbi:MAG TPA: hypothetical protein VN688_13180 [Gemmataceae bacterium]|nr:hypothetical protein [Gemmataceae bacterium]